MSILRNKRFLSALVTSIILLIASFAVGYYAGTYATERESNPVTDVILSNTNVHDVDGIFIYGSIFFWVGVAILLLRDLRLAPLTLKGISVFVLIRSFFISLTHIGPFPERLSIPSNFIINKFTFGGDLFFSGHTGLPFLLALLYWKNQKLRYMLLLTSFIFGTAVLLGHLHYSIDVFAAYFITYSIFHIVQTIFPEDRMYFESSPLITKRNA